MYFILLLSSIENLKTLKMMVRTLAPPISHQQNQQSRAKMRRRQHQLYVVVDVSVSRNLLIPMKQRPMVTKTRKKKTTRRRITKLIRTKKKIRRKKRIRRKTKIRRKKMTKTVANKRLRK